MIEKGISDTGASRCKTPCGETTEIRQRAEMRHVQMRTEVRKAEVSEVDRSLIFSDETYIPNWVPKTLHEWLLI